jgi:hypothetical protein
MLNELMIAIAVAFLLGLVLSGVTYCVTWVVMMWLDDLF